jgi:hypothetical protein
VRRFGATKSDWKTSSLDVVYFRKRIYSTVLGEEVFKWVLTGIISISAYSFAVKYFWLNSGCFSHGAGHNTSKKGFQIGATTFDRHSNV